MPYQSTYRPEAPERSEVDGTPGLRLLEFGANWCGHCQAAQPAIQSVLAKHPDLNHRKIEDGPGRRLGRSFRVKLWPTLILLRDGQEIARTVRPATVDDVRTLFQAPD